MNPNERNERAWSRLTAMAREAPAQTAEVPHGFATRVLAQWREGRGEESALAVFEWLTLRGLALAVVILLGCAAFGYQDIIGIFTGETALAGGWLDPLLTL